MIATTCLLTGKQTTTCQHYDKQNAAFLCMYAVCIGVCVHVLAAAPSSGPESRALTQAAQNALLPCQSADVAN